MSFFASACPLLPISSVFLLQVIAVEQSSVFLMPSRAEISLSKADPGPWAQLEQLGKGMAAEKVGEGVGPGIIGEESENSDDDLSWTEEEEEVGEGE